MQYSTYFDSAADNRRDFIRRSRILFRALEETEPRGDWELSAYPWNDVDPVQLRVNLKAMDYAEGTIDNLMSTYRAIIKAGHGQGIIGDYEYAELVERARIKEYRHEEEIPSVVITQGDGLSEDEHTGVHYRSRKDTVETGYTSELFEGTSAELMTSGVHRFFMHLWNSNSSQEALKAIARPQKKVKKWFKDFTS